jgi:hypothetical protein
MSHVHRSKTIADILQTTHFPKGREVDFQAEFEDQIVIIIFATQASIVSAATNSPPRS